MLYVDGTRAPSGVKESEVRNLCAEWPRGSRIQITLYALMVQLPLEV